MSIGATLQQHRILPLEASVHRVASKTFSAIAASMNPDGAISMTFPLATSASSTTPRTPPKRSPCECEYTTPTTGRLPSFSFINSNAARAVSLRRQRIEDDPAGVALMKLMLARS